MQLTQDYYECYPSTYNAFLDAVGIASGNTSLAVPIIVFLLLPLLYFLLVAINQVRPVDHKFLWYCEPQIYAHLRVLFEPLHWYHSLSGKNAFSNSKYQFFPFSIEKNK